MLILTDALAVGIGLAGVAGILFDVPLLVKRIPQPNRRHGRSRGGRPRRPSAGSRASRPTNKPRRPQ